MLNASSSIFFCLLVAFCNNTALANTTSEPEVKQSNSGICHDRNSAFYERTKNFKPFDSIAACIDAGGRLPEGKGQLVYQKVIDQKSDFESLTIWSNLLTNRQVKKFDTHEK
jgi:hypothetical protein